MLRAKKGDRTENFHLRDLCSYSKVSCIDCTGAHLTITNSYACSQISQKWIQFERKGEFCDFSLRVGVWKLKKMKDNLHTQNNLLFWNNCPNKGGFSNQEGII